LKFIIVIYISVFAILSLNAIELTKPLMLDISRTYGYVTSQSFVVEKLKEKYPSKKYELNKAKMEFDLKFKPSIENIKKSFGDKYWNEYKSVMDPKLIEQVNNIDLDNSYRDSFANEVFQRVKGNIESPVIETLLIFHPKYQKYPEIEFTDGFKKRLYSKDTTKAKGVDFYIDIPKSWKVREGKRPNTLWLGTYNNGYLDENNSPVSFTAIVKDLPEKIDYISNKDTQDFCNEVHAANTLKECTKITLENLPAIYSRSSSSFERLRNKIDMEVAGYYVFYKNKMILLEGMVGKVNNEISKNLLNEKFNKYLPLFDQIANSLVINDLYKDKYEESETNYYLYELFDNKFQVVFPGAPSIQEIPEELLNRNYILKSLPYEYTKELTQKQIDDILDNTIEKMKNSQPYIFTDTKNQMSFTSQSMPSGLEHKNYLWSGMKNTLDKQIKDILKTDGRTIIDFTSSLDKYIDTYIAIYTNSYYLEGQKIYSTTKHIFYKDKVYKWSVSYVNKEDKTIFDEYQHNVKILK